MVIGIHAEADLAGKRTGVEEYLYRFLEKLTELPEAYQHRIFLYYKKDRALDFLKSDVFVKKQLFWPFLWTQMRLGFECLAYPPDVLFVPTQIPPFIQRAKTVITVHGLEFIHYPEKYSKFSRNYLYWGTKMACNKAAHIIAVSQATKNDLVNFMDITESKITVVYHGTVQYNDYLKEKSEINSPYFLYIGRIELKKNVDGLIRAFEYFKTKTGYPHKLILAGKMGFGYERILNGIGKEFKDDVFFIDYIPEKKKFNFLKYAEAFVFPSWYEGFGMPILEAQSTGTLVITSKISSMPEIAGDGAIFVDPSSVDDICSAMISAVDNKILKDSKIQQGFLNIKRFSWEKCAKETFNILTKI